MFRTAACISFTSLLAACSLITGPSDGEQLADARARWDRAGPDNYDYDVRWDCFCGGLVGRWLEVSVRGNVVIRATYADTGLDVEPQYFPQVPTVAGLFDQVATIIAEDPDHLEVEYDAERGQPVMLSVDRIRNAVDDEYSFQSRNLQAIPVLLGRVR